MSTNIPAMFAGDKERLMAAIEGRSALVTGGSSGIGLATVERFTKEGAQVAVVDLRPPPGGQGELYIEADVGDASSWDTIVDQVVRKFGGIDIAFLNAGVTTGEGQIGKLTDEQYERVMHVNVDHVVFGARALVEHMRPRGGGSIVATASIAGLTGFAYDPIYTMSKHAVVGLVRSLGPALEADGIKVNAVCPGITDTPMTAGESVQLRQAGFPLLEADEIAEGVMLALASGGSGLCIVCQPGRPPEVYRFAGIPGPRTPGGKGMAPPL
jgi:NAD(P)-dependent dehydrogenase (short-subunit alcohol dehydrogenase family)